MSERTSVVVVDDDPDLAALLSAVVACDDRFDVIGAADAGVSAAAMWSGVDVVVVGCHRRTGGGLDVVDTVRETAPQAAIVFLVDWPDPITLLDALAHGADAVLSSGTAWREVVPAIAELAATAVATGR